MDNSHEIVGILSSFQEEIKQLRQIDDNSEQSKELYGKIEKVLSDENQLSADDVKFTMKQLKGIVDAGKEDYKKEAAQVIQENQKTLGEVASLVDGEIKENLSNLEKDVDKAVKAGEGVFGVASELDKSTQEQFDRITKNGFFQRGSGKSWSR